MALACFRRSSSFSADRSDRLIETSTPFSGWRRRCFFSVRRNPSQEALSTSAWLSCVVYRPAVSISTASSVNHQSQLRVPPTPFSAWAPPGLSDSGKFNPQFNSAVVLPEPGGPMNMYQGSWPRRLRAPRPPLVFFSVASASFRRSDSSATSSAEAI